MYHASKFLSTKLINHYSGNLYQTVYFLSLFLSLFKKIIGYLQPDFKNLFIYLKTN